MAIFCSNPTFFFTLALFLISSFQFIHSLSTVSISEVSNQTLVCVLVPSPGQQWYLNCTSFPEGIRIPVGSSGRSYTGIVGGNGFLCALSSSSSSTSIMVCWRFDANGTNLSYKRIYSGPLVDELDSGNSHICGLFNGTERLQCWQWPEFDSNGNSSITSSLAVGDNFVCGLNKSRQILCLGSDTRVTDRTPGGNYSLVAAGFRHACAISLNGSLECWGEMVGVKPPGVFTSLALGENRSCALRPNGRVICWGENNYTLPASLQETTFISIEAKQNIFCGILSKDISLSCWGNDFLDSNTTIFNHVVPGPCRKQCTCSPLPFYGNYCGQGLMICQLCIQEPSNENPEVAPPPSLPSPSPQPQPPPKRTTNGGRWNRKMVSFLVVGCVGSLSLVSVLCFLFFKYCKIRGCRVRDSGPLEDPVAAAPQQSGQTSSKSQQPQKVIEKKLSQLVSMGNGSHLEEFSLENLLKATNGFSEEHKIGSGSFGSVYAGTLEDGREVAIKRAEHSASSSHNIYAGGTKRNQEDKDLAFMNELEFLSRLNHKNLVTLLGYCEDCNERLLVYDYMDNGTLHDHLHKLQDSPLMSWAARIKVALDAARGIEYLHEYAVPQVIHRDIKSSNILLDDTWTAKVADFGLSLMGPQDEESHLSLGAVGTVGYMDPEYYRLQQLTTKSDVYSFGVMLLELLSGRKAIHKNESGVPRNVVDYAVPYIVQDEIHRVLDRRVPPPTPFEIEAVAYVGYLAADCVKSEGKVRPTMTEIVNNLERALAACLALPVLSRSSSGSSA